MATTKSSSASASSSASLSASAISPLNIEISKKITYRNCLERPLTGEEFDANLELIANSVDTIVATLNSALGVTNAEPKDIKSLLTKINTLVENIDNVTNDVTKIQKQIADIESKLNSSSGSGSSKASASGSASGSSKASASGSASGSSKAS